MVNGNNFYEEIYDFKQFHLQWQETVAQVVQSDSLILLKITKKESLYLITIYQIKCD